MEKCFDIRANMDKTENEDSMYHHSTVLMPCYITIAKTKEFKDGSSGYLVFGTFMNATSKERPSLGQIRARSYDEALEKVQEMLSENLEMFYKEIGM